MEVPSKIDLPPVVAIFDIRFLRLGQNIGVDAKLCSVLLLLYLAGP